MSRRKFSEEQEKEIEKQYREEKISCNTLAKRWGCNYVIVRVIILRNGGKLRSPKEAQNTESRKQLISGKNNLMFGRCGENHPLYGTHRPDDVKKKIGASLKGKPSWAKGKKFSDIHRKRISDSNKGKVSYNKGKHLSDMHKEKIRKKLKGHFVSEETKQKIREKTLLQLQNHCGPFKNTKPELKMKEILVSLDIPFKHQFRLGHCLFDFRLLNANILIEVDGDYYHGNPKIFKKLNKMQKEMKERDKKHNEVAKANNFILLRFWESDIKNNVEKIKNKLKNFIGGEK